MCQPRSWLIFDVRQKRNMTPQIPDQDRWWIRGDKTANVAFPHNALVEMTLPTGSKKDGWIVGASVQNREVVYTVEACDGSGDFTCPQASLRDLGGGEQPNKSPEPTPTSGTVAAEPLGVPAAVVAHL